MPTTPEPLTRMQQACRSVLPAWVHSAPAGSVAGVTCSYAPLELLHAAGLTPVRLQAAGSPPAVADSWLPPFTCAPVRGLLGAALSGELDPLAAIVLPHTCDSMQELAGIWQMLRPDQWLLTPVEPLAVDNPHAPAYLREELLATAGRIAAHLDRPVSDEALAGSLQLYNRLRRTVQRVDQLRDRLTAAEAWAALSAAWRMPPEDYIQAAGDLCTRLEEAAPRPARGPALVLSGSLLDEPLIPELIDSLGARVVGDNLCNGTRDSETLAAETGDPWSALAGRLLERPPCPCKHGASDRESRLSELARRRSAQGVIQVLVKFCDPSGFDVVLDSQALAAAGRQRLLLEIEASNAPEQLRTRLQAFSELLDSEE